MGETKTTEDGSKREEKSDSTASSGAEPSTNAATPNIQITHRTNRSAFMFILHMILRPIGPKLTHMTCELPGGSPRLDIPKTARLRVNVKERHVNGMYLYDLTPKKNATPPPDSEKTKRKRIYYFAGGGWRMPASITSTRRPDAAAKRASARVTKLLPSPGISDVTSKVRRRVPQ